MFKSNCEEFQEIYCDAEEELPHKAPAPRGKKKVMTSAFVDTSHAADKKTISYSSIRLQ
jgi:hypothetical protein